MPTIVIDPGHGGTSSTGTQATCVSSWNNAVGPRGTLEKTLTLDVGRRLRDVLQRRGHQVVMTRDRDVNLSLKARADKAREIAAPVFVSIHFNGSTGHTAQGTETFVHTDHRGISAALCRAVQARLVAATGLRDRNQGHPGGVKRMGLCVLRKSFHASSTACCLAEVSFLDLADEERRLQDSAYRDTISAALADGVEDYLAARSDASDAEVSAEVEATVGDGAVEFSDEQFEDAVDFAVSQAGLTVDMVMSTSTGIAAPAWRAPAPYSRRARAIDLLRERPLLTGALAILVGSLIAAALRSTRIREHSVGEMCADAGPDGAVSAETADSAMDRAEPAAGQGTVVVNRGMNPIFGQNPDMSRASRHVRRGTLERHRAALPVLTQGARYFAGQVTVNDSIAKSGTSREDETRDSRHFYGDAFDLSTRGMSNRQQMRLALSMMKAGFKGFGFGGTILHVDTGARRAWSYRNSTYAGFTVSELDSAFTSGRIPRRFFERAGIRSMDDL